VEVILERNYEYKMGHPFIHRLIFRFPNRRVDPVRELRRGRIEMIADLSPQEASSLSSKPFLRIESKEGQRICQIYLNVGEYPFDRLGVRKAISLGIDRHEIVMQVFQGFATAAFSCIPSWHRYYDSNPELRAYDPNQAMKILIEEGFTSEFPVSFSLMYTDDRPFRAIADLIMRQLARIGVQVHLVPLAKKDLFDYIYGRNGRDRSLFQAALEDWEDWRGGAEAEQFTWRLYHSNSTENKLGSIPHSWEQELGMAIKACHPKARKSLFSSVITQIDQSLVTIYLCYPHRIWVVRNWVKGEFCNSLGNLFLDRVWVR
jgi:ABC-type transport system substrate-binding protein